jgi:uncharacterized membrane protein YgcG
MASWRGFLRLSLVSCPIYLSLAISRTRSIRLHQIWRPPAAEEMDDFTDQVRRPDRADRSPPRLDPGDDQEEEDQTRAATRIALRPHDPSTGEVMKKEEVVKGLRIRTRPIRHIHGGGTEGPRRGKFEGDRFGEVRAALRHRSRLFRQPVLPLSRRPDRGRDAAGDRRGNSRGRGFSGSGGSRSAGASGW